MTRERRFGAAIDPEPEGVSRLRPEYVRAEGASVKPRSDVTGTFAALAYNHPAMKVWRSKICALVLSLAMVPGAFEIMENAAHLVTEGHLAHAAAKGDRHDPAGPEHGCTPVFHFCGCHASLAFLMAEGPPVSGPSPTGFCPESHPGPLLNGFGPSVERPPRV